MKSPCTLPIMFALTVVASAAFTTSAFPRFVQVIPNAAGVAGVRALGHQNGNGGGATNAFGQAFEAQGTQWTVALCHADSDGDGATNGEELGDPCCTWPQDASGSSGTLTHPGIANTFTKSQLAALKCPHAAAARGGETTNTAIPTNASKDGEGGMPVVTEEPVATPGPASVATKAVSQPPPKPTTSHHDASEEVKARSNAPVNSVVSSAVVVTVVCGLLLLTN